MPHWARPVEFLGQLSAHSKYRAERVAPLTCINVLQGLSGPDRGLVEGRSTGHPLSRSPNTYRGQPRREYSVRAARWLRRPPQSLGEGGMTNLVQGSDSTSWRALLPPIFPRLRPLTPSFHRFWNPELEFDPTRHVFRHLVRDILSFSISFSFVVFFLRVWVGLGRWAFNIFPSLCGYLQHQ